ncbi:MAG TPA: RNA 2',3'-cyclic phosphodiesterase [Burkholderiales bacterium]|nr:RNA 2',3'-cyclic phosphodiesterase [Burkholderiales bacterium]
MRLFFALWPPRDTARALAEWARAVQKHSGGRATAEETIHLTLAFLRHADIATASAAAEPVRLAPFDLPVDEAKYWKHNRIVWVGPRVMPPALTNLVAQLHPALRTAGFVLEDRPFAAHVTLIRKASAPGPLPALPPVSWHAREFVLVRSTPTGTGSRYEVVRRFN